MTLAPEKVLAGKLVRLRPFTDADVPLLHKWFNDPEVLHWLHLSEDPPAVMQSMDAHRQRWERIRDDPGHLSWVIETQDGKPIGELGLLNINQVQRRAELGISIGEKEYWGRGYGTDAIHTLMRHAFAGMGLRRVGLITDEDNGRGIRCYEKCGFVREGLLRAHRLRYGRPINMVQMGVLEGEEVGG